MRRRLVFGTVAVILVVLVALIPPVVVLLRRAAEREVEVRLSSQASAVSTVIADQLLAGDAPTVEQISPIIPPGDLLVITDSDGNELLRFGTATASGVTGTATGPGGTHIAVSSDATSLDQRVRGPLFALGAFAIASVALGAFLAAWMATRLSRPLEQLGVVADRLGGGDFTAVIPAQSGIDEIDGIRAALDSSAQRLDQMLTAERSFTGDATHQLRTGLAGIALRLELLASHPDPAVVTEATAAIEQIDRLTRALDELLALARGGAGKQRGILELRPLVGHHCRDWQARCAAERRQLALAGDADGRVSATAGFVGQIVDILVDNALRHGSGAITITVFDRGLRVRDEGTIDAAIEASMFALAKPADGPHGRGLALARRLARADGGSLELTGRTPTEFELRYTAELS
ncbi:MAG: hypothetical protein RLZZ623_57 [Actinomycetota bacterium]